MIGGLYGGGFLPPTLAGGRSTGSSGSDVADAPESPHAYDDEFNSTVLNAAWQFTSTFGGVPDPYASFAAGNTRMALHTDRRRSWLTVQPPGDGVGKLLHKAIVCPANFFVWSRVSFGLRVGSAVNNDAGISLNLCATSAGAPDINNEVAITVNELDASKTTVQFQKTEGGVFSTLQEGQNVFSTVHHAQPFDSMGIQKIGTTYHGWVFTSSGMAMHMGSTVFAPAITRLAFHFRNVATTSPGNMLIAIDYVRCKESAIYLPGL
jgi:hypothetical protein